MSANYLQLKIKAMSKNEQFARSAVASFCVQLDPTIEEINDIKTAVSEAVTNSVVHGYQGDENGDIVINVMTEGKRATIEIMDYGVGIEDIDKALKPFFTTKPEQERSGMGFAVMQAVMDNLEVQKLLPSGTLVRMIKEIK